MNRKYLPFVSLDDFAFHKGHTYGTLICDLQSKTPLALLPDRLSETVTTWLKKHPFIEVVSRVALPVTAKELQMQAVKLLRFMIDFILLKIPKSNLPLTISTLVPAAVTWAEPQSPSKEIPFTRTEQTVNNRRNKKWELIQEIQTAHIRGKNFSRLAREYKLDRRTINKYIKMVEPPECRRHRKDLPICLRNK